jgi:hypothetical protein
MRGCILWNIEGPAAFIECEPLSLPPARARKFCSCRKSGRPFLKTKEDGQWDYLLKSRRCEYRVVTMGQDARVIMAFDRWRAR